MRPCARISITARRLSSRTVSTACWADRIILVQQGQIVDQGTHEELLQSSPHYSESWQKQRWE